MIVYVADFYRINREHLMYNSAMLDILSSLPQVEKVEFLAHAGQIALIKNEHHFQNSTKVSFVPAKVPEQMGGKHWIKKIWQEFSNVIGLLNKSPKNSLIFFCFLSPISSFFYKLIKVFYRNQKVIITLHGDLDFIQLNKSKFRNLLGHFFIWSFHLKDKNTRYLVLSQTIKDNLLKTGLLQPEEIYAIHHPYQFEAKTSLKTQGAKPINIGHIGVACQEKNTQLIFELARHFSAEVERGRLKFSIIGKLVNIDPFRNQWVSIPTSADMLSRDEFNAQIGALDYAVFFYDDAYYKFCSSGAVLDAINHQVPILTLKNQGFVDLFNSAPGALGYICNDLQAMIAIIDRLLKEPDQSRYDQMVYNLGVVRTHFTIAEVRNQFLQQTKSFIYE